MHLFISVPYRQSIIGAKAAANLEFGVISNAQLIAVPANILKVVMTSDNFWEGSSNVGNNILSSGQRPITDISG